ncbi:DUF3820 family protein [Candidatus Dependentiae bacterium]|nr:DUF3820 family protein [Candidatus Dependentiae bacterium]
MSQQITDNTPMPFGRHIGKPMIEVPAKYLLWLLNEGCTHQGVREYIVYNLDILKKEAGENR